LGGVDAWGRFGDSRSPVHVHATSRQSPAVVQADRVDWQESPLLRPGGVDGWVGAPRDGGRSIAERGGSLFRCASQPAAGMPSRYRPTARCEPAEY
jgi:hypothetical protein